MYSDIIPPKKKYIHKHTEEYNSVKFSSPHISYSGPQKTKKTIILFLAACVVIGLVLYQIISHSTSFKITPKTTRFEIKQNIPLISQGRDKESLSYSLVYVPATQEYDSVRNPFSATGSTTVKTTPAITNASHISTIHSTSTGMSKRIIVINTTDSPVSLRKDTRFDVDGVIYTLEEAREFPITTKPARSTIGTSTKMYKVVGFKDSPSYDKVYGVPESAQDVSADFKQADNTISTTSNNIASSTIPPKELLSLMPPQTLALQKSTIYDKLVDQSAVVVFDQSSVEDFLSTHIQQVQEYYKALKPFGESISYDISIIDYTLNTSQETGKPVSFSSFIIEITPHIDTISIPLQFAGFSKETMDTIEKQINQYIGFKTTYKPFWSKTVAQAKKIDVEIFSENQ